MASPDRHFATAAIFTQSTGLTPNSGDAALYIKSDNKAYIKDSAGTEVAVASIGGTAGSVDNAILRADGTGGSTLQNSNIVIDDVATATQDNVAILNASSATNSALVLTPKGTGALILGPKPDGTAVGGNARGAGAIDLQVSRTAATQVATAINSVICGGANNTITTGGGSTTNFIGGGSSNTCSGNWSSVCVGGLTNTASGVNSVVCGGGFNIASGSGSGVFSGGGLNTTDGNTASGTCSSILGGLQGLANRTGMQAHAAGRFAAQGDAQRARFVMRCKTTTNAAVEMALDGGTTYLSIPSGKYLTGTINIAGIKSDGSATASYIRQFSIKNVAATTTLVGTVNTIGIDTASLTSISITANDASDFLSVQVTGILSETWRWVASVDVVEVAYGT